LPADDLPGADIGVKQVLALLDDMNAEKRAPGMPDKDNLVLVQMRAKIFGYFDAILHHLRKRHGRRNRFAADAKAASGATLVPLNHGEMLFPGLPGR
jgi:hypothetical protein